MKKNLFLLKDLLGLSSTNKWLQYQKMCTLLNRAINLINAKIHIMELLQWSLLMLNQVRTLTFMLGKKKNPKFKVSDKEYQNIKIYLLKVTLQIRQKKFFLLRKSEILYRVQMSLVMLTVKKLLEQSVKNNCKR